MISLPKMQLSLGQSFGVAAWIVIAGVAASWVVVKQGSAETAANLPEIPSFTLTTVQDMQEVTLIEQAERAFAAGRIARPEGDSALHYYRKMLERDPENDEAAAGIRRVRGYLVNGAETALRSSDLSLARELAMQVLEVDAGNLAAKSVIARVDQREAIGLLTEEAVEHITAGRLTRPQGSNALETYREVLAIDPGNAIALQGIESVAQRLATLAQTEAFAENHARAAALIALAKEIAPNARGIGQTEKLTLQWSSMVKDQAMKDDLLQAARALQSGNLLGDAAGEGALQLYRSVLEKDPGSEAARAGIDLVLDALLERAWQQARDEDLAAMAVTIEQAGDAGADAGRLVAVREELAYLTKLRRARAGEFDTVLSVRDLRVKRQSTPVLPRHLDAGWVELLFTVTEKGEVADVLVIDSSHEDLHENAVSAVMRWRFDPFLENGRPLPVRSGIRFSFQT